MTTLNTAGLEELLGRLGVQVPIPQFEEADVLNNPLDIGRSYYADILRSLVNGEAVTVYSALRPPNNIDGGDLAVALPRLRHGVDSEEFAFELLQKWPNCPLLIPPFPDGVHLRTFFEPNTLPRLFLPYIGDRRDSYGRDITQGLRDPSSPDSGCNKVVVEFQSPNIAKEFEGKHLRSTIFGAYVANQYEAMGWDAVRINYLGDWGKDIALLSVGWQKYGSEEKFEENPVRHLLEVWHKVYDEFEPELIAWKYARNASKKTGDEKADLVGIENKGIFAERNAFFKKLEENDEEAMAFWKRVRDVNVEYYTQLNARLNINFDEYSGESQVQAETMAEVEKILKNKNVYEESDGAWIVDLGKHASRPGVGIIRDRGGSSTFLLRGLATALERSRKHSFDKMIYVSEDKSGHFSKMKRILDIMDMSDLSSKLEHVNFCEVSQVKDKLGRDHLLGHILDRCRTSMNESLQAHPDYTNVLGNSDEAAEATAISALLCQEVSARRNADHAFDIRKMTSFDSGTGPNFQYWYAKLSSTLEAHLAQDDLADEDFTGLANGNRCTLLRILIQFPDVTKTAYKTLEPANIMSYLAHVISQLTIYLEAEDAEPISPTAKFKLCEAARIVLESGMKLVGITPVPRSNVVAEVVVSEEGEVKIAAAEGESENQ